MAAVEIAREILKIIVAAAVQADAILIVMVIALDALVVVADVMDAEQDVQIRVLDAADVQALAKAVRVALIVLDAGGALVVASDALEDVVEQLLM